MFPWRGRVPTVRMLLAPQSIDQFPSFARYVRYMTVFARIEYPNVSHIIESEPASVHRMAAREIIVHQSLHKIPIPARPERRSTPHTSTRVTAGAFACTSTRP